MLKHLRSIVAVLARRFRCRAVVELENLALRHQLHVLRRQRPGRPRLFTIDRLLWVWLHRLWPRCLDTMVLVKPATVVQWHRQGFRLFWRWRSRSGRPSLDLEVRDLIRQMSSDNPLWGAPRIHGELLKLGIEISQATVAKYMVRRRGRPSPTWRCFLRNQAAGFAAIDMFVVASASFRLLYVMIILAHDRRKIVRFDVTRYPTAGWLARQITEAFPWDTAPRYLLPTAMPHTERNSADKSMRWKSPRLSARRDHLGRMHMSNASSVRFAVSNGMDPASLSNGLDERARMVTSTIKEE
jgi:putative transposase